MRHGHPYASNLFSRLVNAKADKHTPLENFCTEALVWCLRHSKYIEFRKRFLETCAEELLPTDHDSGPPSFCPRISTQVREGGVQFDIEIQWPNKCRWIIEAKVDAPLTAKQIRDYEKLLPRPNRLILLVPKSKRIPPGVNAARIYWEDVCEIAGVISSKHYFDLLDQFYDFLKTKNMSPITLPKLTENQLTDPSHLVGYQFELGRLLERLKVSKNLRADRGKKPELGYNEVTRWYDYGLYLTNNDGWVGIVFPNGKKPKRLVLWFEITVKGKFSKEDVKREADRNSAKQDRLGRGDKLNVEPDEENANTHIHVFKRVGNEMSTADVESWIKEKASLMKELSKLKRRIVKSAL